MIMKIGHRGAMGYEPENTIRSFKRAIRLAADMIELDVHCSKDGRIVVMHDEKVDRTTNGRGYVAKKTLAELKKLDAGQGEKIPTLPEVLDVIRHRVKMNIELKGKRTARPVAEVLHHYIRERGWRPDDFLISSFNWEELGKFHRIYPEIPVGVLGGKNMFRAIEFAKQLGAFAIHLQRGKVTRRVVTKIHRLGMRVFSWTVNTAAEIKKIKNLGVDGIYSDYPDRL